MKGKLVLAFGSFDILHPGHVAYLEKAKRLGDRLVVVVARDKSIMMIKHREPVMDEQARVKMVGSLKMVDKAVLGNKISHPSERYNILAHYKPSVIVFGYDQKVNKWEIKKWLKAHKINSRIVSLSTGYDPKRFKSSLIRKALLSNK